jgi:hypothetical protein
MLTSALLASSASALAITLPQVFTLPREILDSSDVPFLPQTIWLGQNLNYSQFAPLVNLANSTYGPIQGRGEAHITVITPPEFFAMQSVMGIDEINSIALAANIQSTVFYPYCLATQSAILNGVQQNSYNVLIHAPGLEKLRANIGKLVTQRGGVFDAANFTPHITVGFTLRDLFESDGVAKTAKTCIRPVIVH